MKSKVDEIANYYGNEQKAYVLKEIGDVSRFRLNGNRVLVATYIQPKKSKGGIFFTDNQTEESIYQGKVGYVIKKGPLAFIDDENTKFCGFNPDVGDWVFYRPNLALMQLRYNGIDCRVFSDGDIAGDILDPEKMW